MMALLTNFEEVELKDVEACIRISGLNAEIRHEAYNYIHQIKPGFFSLWYEKDGSPETSAAVNRYFQCNIKLKEAVTELIVKMGVPRELLINKTIYRGCEKDYFPEYLQDVLLEK